jgi:hypothetical protein
MTLKPLFTLLLLLFVLPYVLRAQPLPIGEKNPLPSLSISTEQASNKLTWFCQYDKVKSIAIQRSADSTRNFVTIGVVQNPKKGINMYKDLHPVLGKNFYRLSIEFGGDIEWYSNTYKVILDSATLAKSLANKLETGTTNAIPIGTSTNETVSNAFYFTPSSKVYTNPYTGHINIEIDDALSKRYSLRFFDPAKNEVLRVSRISKTKLILDKNNFNSKGIYSFQLLEGTVMIESGFVTIY